jgi:hypothetical protein
MRRSFSAHLKYYLLFLAIDVGIYWELWNTYFQQDEWLIFGRAIWQLQHLPWSLLQFGAMHFYPMGNITWMILYKLFGLSAQYYAYIGLIFHALAAYLSFLLFERILKNKSQGLILSLLFLVSFPTKQAVVWFGAMHIVIGVTVFVFLYLLYLDHLRVQHRFSAKDTGILAVLFLVGFFYYEEAVILIPLTLLFVYFFWETKHRKKILRSVTRFLIILTVIVGIRFIAGLVIGEKVQFEKDNNLIMFCYNAISIFPKMVIQNIIELEHLWVFARKYTEFAFPAILSEGLTIERTVFEDVVFYLFIPIAFAIGFSYANLKKYQQKILLFSIVFIYLCALTLTPQTRRLYFLESRYLYLANFGVLLLLAMIYKGLRNGIHENGKYIKKIAVLFIILYGIYSYTNIQNKLKTYYIPLAKTRKEILHQIQLLYPTIGNNTVFYLRCKEQDDCIPNGLVVPFQSGFGQMLLVLYGRQKERLYAPFMESFYLWDMEAQDYRKIGNIGFGYFRDMTKIQELVRNGLVLPDDIIAFTYDRNQNIIEDISKEVRSQLLKTKMVN